LGALWHCFNQSALSVLLDLSAAQGVDEVVFAAMHGLRRKVRWVPPVRFARLRLAFKALSYVDDGGGRAAFDAYMRGGGADAGDNFDGYAWRVTALLTSLDQQVIVALLVKVARMVFSGLNRARDAAPLDWFAHNGAFAGPGTGLDALWAVYRAYHDDADRIKKQSIDHVLCAALLADLSAEYSRKRLLGPPVSNCLLLLDNADQRAAGEFLDLLEKCRIANASNAEPADPLLVVAVQRTQPPPKVGEPVACTDENLDLTAAPGWWCPVRLTDLNPGNIVELLSPTVLHLLGSVRHDADFVYALTGGHPAAARQLIQLLTQRTERALNPRGLLEARPPGHDDGPRAAASPNTVEESLIRRVLAPDVKAAADGLALADNSTLLDAMAVCAVTEDLKLAASQAVFASMRWPLRAADVHLEFETRLWLRAGPPDGKPHLHPLVALLLRRRLARSPELWCQVHQDFAAHYGNPDEELKQRHILALVEPAHMQELPSVAKYLESELDQRSAGDWLRVLDRVSAAPNRVRSTQDPRNVVASIAGHAQPGERRRVITRLAVAHWLYQDRAFDPCHRLAQIIANEYDNLAQLPGPDAELFYQRSAQYRQIEKEWNGSCR
jgi:hypothetical protein